MLVKVMYVIEVRRTKRVWDSVSRHSPSQSFSYLITHFCQSVSRIRLCFSEGGICRSSGGLKIMIAVLYIIKEHAAYSVLCGVQDADQELDILHSNARSHTSAAWPVEKANCISY